MSGTEPKKRPQRNALRSQRMIKRAFLKLLYEKDLDKITVTDVVREAEICRGTFYSHYNDIDDLCAHIQKEVQDKLREYVGQFSVTAILDDPEPTVRLLLERADRDREYFRYLLLNGSTRANAEKFVPELAERCIDELMTAYHGQTREGTRAFLMVLASGLAGLIHHWLSGDLNLSVDRLTVVTCNVVRSAKAAYLAGMEKA